MSTQQETTDTFDLVIAAIPACALDKSGLRAQRARYARLAGRVTGLKRETDAVSIEFRENFDRETLEQAIAVERACCPFFRFELDEPCRRLRVTVREPEQLHALDAIAYAFGPPRRS